MKTASTNKKVREIITQVKEGKLVARPEFQRRLVWSIADKNHFLDSVVRGYPFPEIYVADGEVDLETGTQLLVDGLQRVNTIVKYVEADSDLKLTSTPQYKDLSENDKRLFLQYDVSVRDLGSISKEEIIEVFKRINATHYSLTDIEVNNAVYAGAFRQFAERVAALPLFEEHRVFSSLDYKRMGDLRFALQIIISMLAGYGNRDDNCEEFLSRYNDEFPREAEIFERLNTIVDFINECGFLNKSRVWRKADLLSLIVELDTALNIDELPLAPGIVLGNLQLFFNSIENSEIIEKSAAGIYYKAALQASNDRVNRVRRGVIISNLLRGMDSSYIIEHLEAAGLA